VLVGTEQTVVVYLRMYPPTYVPTYIHTYIHMGTEQTVMVYLRMYLPTYVPTYIHTYIHMGTEQRWDVPKVFREHKGEHVFPMFPVPFPLFPRIVPPPWGV